MDPVSVDTRTSILNWNNLAQPEPKSIHSSVSYGRFLVIQLFLKNLESSLSQCLGKLKISSTGGLLFMNSNALVSL